MSTIQVFGPAPLREEVSVQSSKDAAPPMMTAAMLRRKITVLTNVPVIRDVAYMLDILEFLGTRCCCKGDCLVIDARNITQTSISERCVTVMRSPTAVLSVLLGHMEEGCSCCPGGCLVGTRPIGLHLMVPKSLGAEISETEGHIRATCGKGLTGAETHLPYPSVGIMEQVILGSVLARDVTIIHETARELEISQLCRFLNNMRTVIYGMGIDHLMIQGAGELYDSSFQVEGDRIVAGTYAAAVAVATRSMILRGVYSTELEVSLGILRQAGVSVRIEKCCKQIRIEIKQRPGCLNIKTEPCPQFPTDLQSPLMAFLASGEGTNATEERVFKGRFATVRSLIQMGVPIRTEGRKAVIEGHYPLRGAEVPVSDLKGRAAPAVAAPTAQGETLIKDCRHIEWGYEDIRRDMAVLGADVRWLEQE